LVPILAHALTTAFGWRGALRWLGLLMIAVAFPPAFFVRDRPAPERARELPAADSLRPVLTRPAFWLLAIGSMTSIGAVGGTTQNLKLYLSLDRHLGQADIAGILSLLLVGSLVGRITMGWLADRWEKKHVMVLVYAIVALSIPPLAMSSMPAMLRVFAFLFGVGLGGDCLLGVIITADGIAEAVVPMGVAALRDSTGSYGSGFFVLVALAVAGAAAVSMLPSGPNPAATIAAP
ncbi:MAG: MFS transporter, partial [Acidobacteria bacterium]